MGESLLRLAKGMGEAFRNAKDNFKAHTEVLQTGEYIAKIQSCERKKAKEKDTQYIEVQYFIMEGERKGHIEYSRLMLIPERLIAIIKFFDMFNFDTDALADDETGKIIDSYCESIFKASPLVKFMAQRWFRKDETGTLTDEVGGVNIYLKSIIDDIDISSSQSDENQVDEQTAEDAFSKMDKKELREFVLANDNIDISMPFIQKNDEETIRNAIREQLQQPDENATVNNSNEELRLKLLAVCESQVIEEVNGDMSFDDIKQILDNQETGEHYEFEIEGDGCLTEEEIQTLVDCGLDHLIKAPAPIKKVIKKTAVSSGKKTGKK